MEYPISFDDFEKRLKQMFIEHNPRYTKEEKKDILEEFLNGEGKNFIKMSYSSSCGIYSQNKEYWEKNLSKEEILNRFMVYPLNNLEMLLL